LPRISRALFALIMERLMEALGRLQPWIKLLKRSKGTKEEKQLQGSILSSQYIDQEVQLHQMFKMILQRFGKSK
jgi:hypothetical protein